MASILAVDDSASMRQMVAFTLKGAGYDVEEACDGSEALGIAKNKKYVVWSLRYDKQGNLKNGKPCFHCKQTLLQYGFRTIIYSDDNGDLIKTRLDNLDSKQSSGRL